MLRFVVTVGLCCASASALRIPAAMTRRAAVATAASLVGGSLRASAAGNPLVGGDFSGYKARDYGSGTTDFPSAVPAKPGKLTCEEGQRLAPDGFGGKK